MLRNNLENVLSVTDIEEDGIRDNSRNLKFKATEVIIFHGSKKYINPDIFNIPFIKLSTVPDDINDLVVHEVPIQETLVKCQGLWPWCRCQTSKSSTFTKGLRFLLNCRSSYMCTNTRCPNIQDFDVNRHDFIMKNFAAHCIICHSVTWIVLLNL